MSTYNRHNRYMTQDASDAMVNAPRVHSTICEIQERGNNIYFTLFIRIVICTLIKLFKTSYYMTWYRRKCLFQLDRVRIYLYMLTTYFYIKLDCIQDFGFS